MSIFLSAPLVVHVMMLLQIVVHTGLFVEMSKNYFCL